MHALVHLQDVTKMEDWYKVSREDLVRLGGGGLYRHYESKYNLLRSIYPKYLVHICVLNGLISLGFF